MEKIIINKDNLNEEDMTVFTKKVKVLLINSNNEILLGYAHNCYQFPGGTHEEGEELIDTVNREIEEETGIVLNNYDIEPFACSFGYYKDWPEVGENKKVEIYYYEVKTDEFPHLEKTHYTDSELRGHFELRYIPLAEVEEELKRNALEHEEACAIAREMLELFKIYKK